MRVGDLISFKPKSFSDDDWSNPSIVLDGFISDDEAKKIEKLRKELNLSPEHSKSLVEILTDKKK